MPLRLPPEIVEHDARLDARDAPLGIDLEDPGQVARDVDDDGRVAALPGEARAGAAGQNGSRVSAADLERSERFRTVAREHDADRDLAVVRGVRGEERAAASVEADVVADLPQISLE
jgi:hypothetical protein